MYTTATNSGGRFCFVSLLQGLCTEVTRANSATYGAPMRETGEIDRELALLAAVRRAARQLGGEPSARAVDRLLDERLATTKAPRQMAGGSSGSV